MHKTKTIAPFDYRQLYEAAIDKISSLDGEISSLRNENRRLRLSGVPLPNSGFEWLSNLQYKVKDLKAQLDAFKTGQKYIDMWSEFKARLAEKDRENKKLKRELADSRRETVKVRKIWEQIVDDLEKGHAKELSKMGSMIKALEKKLLKVQGALADKKDELIGKIKELYQVKTELEDEKGKTRKLKAQINRDHENSSKSSSMIPNRKKIANNREITGRKPGGQPGHKGHPRKKQEPTDTVNIPVPDEYANSPDYKPTGKVITKQLVDISVELIVTEYSTPEYQHIRTGVRVSAEFPGGMVNEVSYSGNVKAFAFLLNNHCNVSIAKTSGFISELTGGRLNLSAGMINGLSKQFSLLTEAEQKKAFADLLVTPVMNTDFTTARVNGQKVSVIVCADSLDTLYFAREHKGHEGVKGTPVEDYQGILVHDHDRTFYNYGSGHQECLEHVLRYLIDSMQNEAKLSWNKQMWELLREAIHFRKHLDPNDKRDPSEIDPEKVAELESRYDEILALAKEEYDYEPPSKYYKEGLNLAKRLGEYRENHLLFLHDRRVPWTNNLSERKLRILKRKIAQAMTFRSFDGLAYFCISIGQLALLAAHGENLFDGVASIFDRQ